MSSAAPPGASLLAGGARSEGAGGERRVVFDPATGEPIASVAQATAQDVDRAARMADAAYRDDWKRRTPKDRAAVLFRLAALVRGKTDELAQLESRNTGKPIASERGEV